MQKIILATISFHRKRLFKTLGLNFTCEGSNIDEYAGHRPKAPKELVKYLSKLKAEAVAEKHNSGIIIGFDSVGYFNGKIFEKPEDFEESYKRLKMLSGKMHEFYIGIYMINLDTGKILSDIVETKAWFRELRDEEIKKYLAQDPMYKTCALGYAPPEHYSSTFVDRIEGSYNNLCWGLPVERIMEMLFDIGYDLTE